MKWHYYNEFDPQCCEWIRGLIAAGLVPDGEVDGRSIADVRPGDLKGFIQCHFFAGILGWPYALRAAGWPEDRQIWSLSCPCQPFSCAGQGKGEADERNLWPVARELIRESAPLVCIGEQVGSTLGREWLARVQGDFEGMGFALGAADICSAGIGAPNIRQRLYWVAQRVAQRMARTDGGGFYSGRRTESKGAQPKGRNREPEQRGGIERLASTNSTRRPTTGTGSRINSGREPEPGCEPGGLVLSNGSGPQPGRQGGAALGHGSSVEPTSAPGDEPAWIKCPEDCGEFWCRIHDQHACDCPCPPIDEWTTDPYTSGMVGSVVTGLEGHAGDGNYRNEPGRDGARETGPASEAVGAGNFWHDSAWWYCTDDKFRRVPIEPKIFLLASRYSAIMGGRLQGGDQTKTERIKNGNAKKVGHRKILPQLQTENGEGQIREHAGIQPSLPSEKVLQPGLHGESLHRDHQSSEPNQQPEPSHALREAHMRAMWEATEATLQAPCPSPGSESTEQLAYEFDHTLRGLSQAASRATLEGCPSSKILHALLRSCEMAGNVRAALSTLEEISRSIGEKGEVEYKLDEFQTCLRRLRTYSMFPLAGKIEGRTALLKGIGNSLNFQLATEFVRAYLEI